MRHAWIRATAVAAAGWLAVPVAAPATTMEVRVELVAAAPLTGRLVAIDGDTIRIASAGGEQSLPVATIRQIVRTNAAPGRPQAVSVTTTDGGTIAGDDFVQEGPRGIVARDGGRIELPMERVRRVAWLAAGEEAPAWLAAIPERPKGDLAVVRREAGHEFVACAVAGVSADHVTVVLDGETIPVKRAKVMGIEWLREPAPAGGLVVRLDGGRLSARSVGWSEQAFEVDDLRLPPNSFLAIDFAAGRTTPLAGLSPESVTVEPFFGALATDKTLAAFFAPRTVAGVDGEPVALVVRPRSVTTWRVPAESRRFRATLTRGVPPEAVAAVEVALALDGREAFRRRLGGPAGDEQEPIAIDLDVAGGRRLTLTIDFVAGDIGCGVRVAGGAFEK